MEAKVKPPPYIFLLAELVGWLEVAGAAEKLSPEVKEYMLKRAQDLKSIGVYDIDAEKIHSLLLDARRHVLIISPIE